MNPHIEQYLLEVMQIKGWQIIQSPLKLVTTPTGESLEVILSGEIGFFKNGKQQPQAVWNAEMAEVYQDFINELEGILSKGKA